MSALNERAAELHNTLSAFVARCQSTDIGEGVLVASGLLRRPLSQPYRTRPRLVVVTDYTPSPDNPYLAALFAGDILEADIVEIAQVLPTEANRPPLPGAEPVPLSDIAIEGLRQKIVDTVPEKLDYDDAIYLFYRMEGYSLEGPR